MTGFLGLGARFFEKEACGSDGDIASDGGVGGLKAGWKPARISCVSDRFHGHGGLSSGGRWTELNKLEGIEGVVHARRGGRRGGVGGKSIGGVGAGRQLERWGMPQTGRAVRLADIPGRMRASSCLWTILSLPSSCSHSKFITRQAGNREL